VAKGGTTLYLNPEIVKQARHKALDLNIKSDSAMVNEALKEWVEESRDSHSSEKRVISESCQNLKVSAVEFREIQ
jgi:hypothetical protein